MEKNIKIISLFLLIVMNVYAQTDDITTYEQARYDLADKAIVKICEPLTEYEMTALMLPLANELKKVNNIFDQTAILEGVIAHLCELSEFLKVDQSYIYVSNSLNLYSYEQYVLQSWHALGKWYMAEREKLDKTKTPLDSQREEERNKEREFKNTPYYKLIEEISDEFEEWATRGEYEKTVDYEYRMENKAISKFDAICFAKCNRFWQRNTELCLNGYDPDTELQKVILVYEDDYHNLKGEATIPLDVVKDYHECIRIWRDKYNDKFGVFNYDYKRSYARSLCVIENHIFPQEAIFYIVEPNTLESWYSLGENCHWLTIKFTIGEPFKIVCDDLKTIKPDFAKYLKGHTFVYSR